MSWAGCCSDLSHTKIIWRKKFFVHHIPTALLITNVKVFCVLSLFTAPSSASAPSLSLSLVGHILTEPCSEFWGQLWVYFVAESPISWLVSKGGKVGNPRTPTEPNSESILQLGQEVLTQSMCANIDGRARRGEASTVGQINLSLIGLRSQKKKESWRI